MTRRSHVGAARARARLAPTQLWPETAPGPCPPTANPVQVVLNGRLELATSGNPRHVEMPRFKLVLIDAKVAAVPTHIRTSWGNHCTVLTELSVARQRGNGTPP